MKPETPLDKCKMLGNIIINKITLDFFVPLPSL